jgi:hypothetical protein
MADLAHDPVIAYLFETGAARSLSGRLIASVVLDLFDLDQGREHLADLVGHFGKAVDVLFDAGPLTPAITLGELLGQLVEPAVVVGTG